MSRETWVLRHLQRFFVGVRLKQMQGREPKTPQHLHEAAKTEDGEVEATAL